MCVCMYVSYVRVLFIHRNPFVMRGNFMLPGLIEHIVFCFFLRGGGVRSSGVKLLDVGT